MNRLLRVCILSFFCAAMLFSGCIDLSRDYPQRDFYLVNLSRDSEAPPADTTAGILQIGKFRVSPRYDAKELVYRIQENAYEADYYNRFFVEPSVMISEEVVEWIESAGLFRQVLVGPGRIDPDYILEGNVPALYGDFTQSPPLAVMEMEFTLLRELPAGPELLLRKSYRREIPLHKKSPEALIDGFEKAFETILTRVERDLREINRTPSR